jgi:hypothetical protein
VLRALPPPLPDSSPKKKEVAFEEPNEEVRRNN